MQPLVSRSLRQHVVACDHDVAAGHHQDHGQQTGHRDRVAGHARRTEATVAPTHSRVQVLGDPVGVDDGDQAVDQGGDIDPEDGRQDERVDDQSHQFQPVHPQEHARPEGDQEDRRGRETEGPHRRAGVGVAETGEDQREERRHERRSGARSRLLRVLHRA